MRPDLGVDRKQKYLITYSFQDLSVVVFFFGSVSSCKSLEKYILWMWLLFRLILSQPSFFCLRFNYRSTHHLSTNGFYEFLNWFDERAWYPLGRIVGGTVSFCQADVVLHVLHVGLDIFSDFQSLNRLTHSVSVL